MLQNTDLNLCELQLKVQKLNLWTSTKYLS